MKTTPRLCILTLILAGLSPVGPTQQPATQPGRRACRIVDEVSTNTGDVYYVDGRKVPGDIGGVLLFLREREKTSHCTCLLAFVTTSARIRGLEDLRVIAGKMDYKEFHAYLYDYRRDFATEILYYGSPLNLSELRWGPEGSVPLPDENQKKATRGQRLLGSELHD